VSPKLSLNPKSDELALDAVTRRHIEMVLRLADGKVNGPDGAAAMLKVHPNTLRKRMQKLGIAFGRQYKDHYRQSPSAYWRAS